MIGIGYVAADVSQGTATVPAVALALANMSGVLVALLVFVRLGVAGVRGATPSAVGYFGGTWSEGWLSWFACDLVNYACLLPALLTVRSWRWTCTGLLGR